MSELLEMAMLAKQAAAADPDAEGAVQALTRAQAAKITGIGGAATGALMGAAIGGAAGAKAPVFTGPKGAVLGAATGALAGGALMGANAAVNGYIGQALVGKKKEASENMINDEEIQLAKVAAEEMYQTAIDEANEKIAFAQMLYSEATGAEHFVKEAQDNGPGIGVPYIDQVKTPAGAAALGAGAGVGGVLGYMKNPSAVGAIGGGVLGAGVVAGAGALKSFIDQHRMARAQQHAAQMGNLPQAGQ